MTISKYLFKFLLGIVAAGFLERFVFICMITEEQASDIIKIDLEERKLNKDFLGSISTSMPNSCGYGATYSSNTEYIEYHVALDPIHGVEHRVFDLNRDKDYLEKNTK